MGGCSRVSTEGPGPFPEESAVMEAGAAPAGRQDTRLGV